MKRPSFLCGLIGRGIQASRTPALHEREGDEQGLRLLYTKIDLTELGLDADALPELITAAERMGFCGLNVTHPCKQTVLPLLDQLSPEAAALGAVNTVVLRDGTRTGHNTDWWGYAENFRRNMAGAARANVVQFGAGGAGSAVAYALCTLGVEHLTIVDVERGRAETVAADLCARFGAGRVVAGTEDAVRSADGIVNTTPLGMANYPGLPLAASSLRPDLWVSDIVYLPIETALLSAARSIGCRTLDGGGMAVFQAVAAFELFTGSKPDAARMLDYFQELGADLLKT